MKYRSTTPTDEIFTFSSNCECLDYTEQSTFDWICVKRDFLLITDHDVVLDTDMSSVDIKPTDIEIEVPIQSHVSCLLCNM